MFKLLRFRPPAGLVLLCAAIAHADSIEIHLTPTSTQNQVYDQPVPEWTVGTFEAAPTSDAPGPTAKDGVFPLLAAVSGDPIMGDANLDERVNFTDLLVVAQDYGMRDASWARGDFDSDHKVGFSDLLLLAQNYGESRVAASTPAPLPSAAWGSLVLALSTGAWVLVRQKWPRSRAAA